MRVVFFPLFQGYAYEDTRHFGSSLWAEEFEKIRDVLVSTLGNRIVGIEHVGSTAVPGLWAKPILDIDSIIKTDDRFGPVAERLTTLGYVHEGIGREAFAYRDLPQFTWQS